MNWISLLNSLRALCLLVFAILALGKNFNWFENMDVLNDENLRKFKNLAIVFYGLLYIIELKLILRQKDNTIAKLETKLLDYER